MLGLKKWALQIAVFALLSVLFVQLFPDAKKVRSLRFYLSLLMLLLVFRPFLNGLHLDQMIKEQADIWEESIQVSFGSNTAVDKASEAFADSIFTDSESLVECWLKEWTKQAGLSYDSSEIEFDREQFSKSGELKIQKIELSVGGLQLAEKAEFEKQLCRELELKSGQVLLKRGGVP